MPNTDGGSDGGAYRNKPKKSKRSSTRGMRKESWNKLSLREKMITYGTSSYSKYKDSLPKPKKRRSGGGGEGLGKPSKGGPGGPGTGGRKGGSPGKGSGKSPL
jgi:hypothetical protein